MTSRSIGLNDALYDYLLEHSLNEHPLLVELRAETAKLSESNMQIAPEQGQFMAMIARMLGARRYLEVGTFTGYSALAVTMAMPEQAKTICLDISEEWTDIAQRYWIRAGLADRIDLHLRPANETLQKLRNEGWSGDFDLAFIDADKSGYIDYYEHCVDLVRVGGVILIDNTLWDGDVADVQNQQPDTQAIRTFNRHVANDERVDLSMIPLGDGLTLARKRS
ncbi:MAG: class I SAM-dependent methyltransferase [Pseudomonadota bacterium]